MSTRLNIATLTHDAPGRAVMLEKTVESFLAHTTLPCEVVWYVYCNGVSTELQGVIQRLTRDHGQQVTFVTVLDQVNRGVGYGINRLNDICARSEYTLFLEGDWLCLHSDDSGQPTDWLTRCINLLAERPDLDCCYLRRFVSPVDSRQTGLQAWYSRLERPVSDECGLRHFTIRLPVYTNNPLLRRNQAFYGKDVFPLMEYFDREQPLELKGNPEWGRAEMEACDRLSRKGQHLLTAVLAWGVFVHSESTEGLLNRSTMRMSASPNLCGHFRCGKSACRWGYFNEQFHVCALCQRDKSEDQLWHIFRDEMGFLARYDQAQTDEDRRRLIKAANPHPEHTVC